VGVEPGNASILTPAPAYRSDSDIAVARQHDGKTAFLLRSADSVGNHPAERKRSLDLRRMRIGNCDLFPTEIVTQAS
jgi:hypothetical protein